MNFERMSDYDKQQIVAEVYVCPLILFPLLIRSPIEISSMS